MLREMSEKIREKLRESGTEAEDITVIRGSRVRRSSFGETAQRAGEAGQKEISTGELYQIAKIFLETVRNEW